MKQITGANLNPIAKTVYQVRLIYRLLLDKRVGMAEKSVMLAALLYLISPVDFVMIPGLSWADDTGVMLFASLLFVSLCPPKVVKELSK